MEFPTPRLDEDYERFVSLFTRHEPGLRAFVRSLLPGWDEVDEVMQNTSLVLWRKFDQFEPGTRFLPWACTVARFEALKFRRTMARDRHVFTEELVNMLADEAAEEVDDFQDHRRALETCLSELPDRQRQILMAAYAPGRRINDVAAEIGKSATALYKSLNRTRAALSNCVQRHLTAEGGGA